MKVKRAPKRQHAGVKGKQKKFNMRNKNLVGDRCYK